MTVQKKNELYEKILKGIQLAYNRLIESTKQTDGELVFSKNGKIIRVKARELK